MSEDYPCNHEKWLYEFNDKEEEIVQIWGHEEEGK